MRRATNFIKNPSHSVRSSPISGAYRSSKTQHKPVWTESHRLYNNNRNTHKTNYFETFKLFRNTFNSHNTLRRSYSTQKTLPYPLSQFPQPLIRNFAVIAHIDHGKTSLSNRLLELTGTSQPEKKNTANSLDGLQVEKERGITVKAHTASMFYKHTDSQTYLLNLIDTPGHVDFSYEVSRALYACQGVLLVIDATQGIQAQTMANYYLAMQKNLTIIPVVNKIDLPTANIDSVVQQIETSLGIKDDDVLFVSAKTGEGVQEIFPAIISKIPHPKGDAEKPLKVLLFDSWFDRFRGVVCLIEVIDGKLKKGETFVAAHSQTEYTVGELGIMYPDQVFTGELYPGQVGFLISGMKSTKEARVGDTFYNPKTPVEPLPGFRPAKAMVYAGLYAINAEETDRLHDSIHKLLLTDASVSVERESRGLLHMHVFVQRLEQEYGIDIILTAPTVPYKCVMRNGKEIVVSNPSDYPDKQELVTRVFEPTINATIIAPGEYAPNLLKLCSERRGEQRKYEFIADNRVLLEYTFPLGEIITGFYDKLKQLTSGYATFDYEEGPYQETDLAKMNILLNGNAVDPLAVLIHRSKVESYGREMVAKLKKLIDREQFSIAIQACVGSKIVAREDIAALRKNVTAKCYGGDITRKRKLLEAQKEGKKKMKQIGNISLSQDVFLAALQQDDS